MIRPTLAIGTVLLLGGCASEEPVGNDYESAAVNQPAPQPLPPQPAPATSREPIGYTSLKAEDCRLIEQNDAEAGYARHRCAGLAGYALEISESDLRQDIVVIAPDGKRSELGLSSKVARGAFNALGATAEWRGKDGKLPTALIVRLGVTNAAEPNQPDTSSLVLINLKPSPCVSTIIPPGRNQNDLARDAADGPAPPCL